MLRRPARPLVRTASAGQPRRAPGRRCGEHPPGARRTPGAARWSGTRLQHTDGGWENCMSTGLALGKGRASQRECRSRGTSAVCRPAVAAQASAAGKPSNTTPCCGAALSHSQQYLLTSTSAAAMSPPGGASSRNLRCTLPKAGQGPGSGLGNACSVCGAWGAPWTAWHNRWVHNYHTHTHISRDSLLGCDSTATGLPRTLPAHLP